MAGSHIKTYLLALLSFLYFLTAFSRWLVREIVQINRFLNEETYVTATDLRFF